MLRSERGLKAFEASSYSTQKRNNKKVIFFSFMKRGLAQCTLFLYFSRYTSQSLWRNNRMEKKSFNQLFPSFFFVVLFFIKILFTWVQGVPVHPCLPDVWSVRQQSYFRIGISRSTQFTCPQIVCLQREDDISYENRWWGELTCKIFMKSNNSSTIFFFFFQQLIYILFAFHIIGFALVCQNKSWESQGQCC